MRQYFRKEFWFDYAIQVKDYCLSYIQNQFGNEDLRNVQKKDLTSFATHVENLLDSIIELNEDKPDSVYYISENLELQIAIKCLQMPILEKKFIGHAILAQKIFQVQQKQNFSAPNMNLPMQRRWLTVERLTQWMQQEQIFQLIFGQSLHSEVIKKSYPILNFLYQNGKITNKEFDVIWDCATKKHEAYKVAILKALNFLASKCSIEHLRYLFAKIKTLPLAEIDKFAINLLRTVARKLSNIDSEVHDGNKVAHHSLIRSNSMKGKRNGTGMFIQTNALHLFGKDGVGHFDDEVLFNKKRLDQELPNYGFDDKPQSKKKGRAQSFGGDKDPMIDATLLINAPPGLLKKREMGGSRKPQNEVEQNNLSSLMEQEQRQEPAVLNLRNLAQLNQELEVNPLDVPKDKEDVNTADDEGSAGKATYGEQPQLDDFDVQNDENFEPIDTAVIATNSNQGAKSKKPKDLEEEKEGGEEASKEVQNASLHELLFDQTLGIDDEEKRELAREVLNFMWSLCLEDSVSEHNLSLQIHKMSIEQLVQTLIYNYPQSIFMHINKCVTCIQHNYSVLSVQHIMQKLIQSLSFPLPQSKHLPKTKREFLQTLEEQLTLTNDCLSSYIEFKRMSLSLIFYQIGSQEQEQENLETQSSLDNDDERSSLQSAHKNQPADHTQSRADQLNIQEDHFLKEGTASEQNFVSPKNKVEEEMKQMFVGTQMSKTQSFQGDNNLAQFGKSNDFPVQIREIDSEDKQSKMMPSMGSIGGSSRHVNSSSKKMGGAMNYQQMAGHQKNEFQIQSQQLEVKNQQNYNSAEVQMDLTNDNQVLANAPNQSSSPNNQPLQNNRDFLNTLITNDIYKYSYYQEMQQRLDFLKFLIGNCPQLLKPQHIQILWECLVINAFYEKERDQFFSWCSQILKMALQLPESKDIDNLGQSIFMDDCLELLFFDTLVKLDFRYITETMYECFERFFIYINEMYGQIVSNSAFDSAFEVFENKLIGGETLWEIVLCVRNDKVYKKAAEFLHKLYKKMSPELIKDRLKEIKVDLLQTCMDQIKTGLKDIQLELGDLYEVPIYQFASSIEDPKNRIARSIQQLCKFIDEFEGLRDRASSKGGLGSQEREININCKNSISQQYCQGPAKINLTVPLSIKIGEVKEQIGNCLLPKRSGKEISITFRGKEHNEDLKTIKELGLQPDQQQINFFVSLKTTSEVADKLMVDEYVQENEEAMKEAIETLKMFLGDMELPIPVIKLALKKCNMNIEEAVCMITDEYQVSDLQEEVRRNEEAQNAQQIVLIEESKSPSDVKEEAKINLIISNNKEYFEMLFDLLNLGITEITNAAWNLLVQIPVNKQLLAQIRSLGNVQVGQQSNWCLIVDPTNAYKMLYSLQIINSLISVNNDSMSEAENKEREEWRLKFLELGGFEHLYMLLITSDIDELLGCAIPSKQLMGQIGSSAVKKKNKSTNKKLLTQPNENAQPPKDEQQMQNNQAKCLGYLISLVKIFLLAALLKVDETKLLTLIYQSSTSPYRKPKTIKQVPPSKLNQLFGTGMASGTGSSGLDMSPEDSQSRDSSRVQTPKFHSSHSSNSATPPQCLTPVDDGKEINLSSNVNQMNKSSDTLTTLSANLNKGGNEGTIFTQVDDFPRLVDQMSSQLVENLLESVVNFNELIQKLLHIIYKAVIFGDTQEASHLVQNSLDLLLPCVVWKPQKLLSEIYKFEHLESLLIRTLMYNSNENVRKSLERTFKVICTQLEIKKPVQDSSQFAIQLSRSEGRNKGDEDVESPKLYILKILINNLPDSSQQSDQCEEFFNLITSIIKVCQGNFKVTQDFTENKDAPLNKSMIILEDGSFSASALLQWCVYQLKHRPTLEDKYSQYTDKILAGYLQLTQSVLEIHPELKKVTGQLLSDSQDHQYGFQLVKTLFDFLFLLPSLEDQQAKHIKILTESKTVVPDTHPKCKRKFTRKKAFNLLLTLCHQSEENFITLLRQLYWFHAQIQKSQKVVSLNEFDADVGVRSAAGYVGLKNFGATCYMNSLMQQLFMIKELRRGILKVEIAEDELESNVLYQLQQIFANLQESEKQYYTPTGFKQAFKFYGEPINVIVQQDTHEFYNLLCDNIEQQLKGTSDENLLKETIGGQVCYETKSLEKEYPYISEREEPFFAIPLDIQNKKNISEALDLYIKADILEGDNKYHCEKYNKHVNAQRRAFLNKLSNTVVLNLKRFEFNYNTMTRLKVNDYCEFPMTINFKPWTKEGIREREKELRKDQKLKKSVNLEEGKGEQDEFNEEGKEESRGGEDALIEEDLGEYEDSEQSLSEKALEREDEEMFEQETDQMISALQQKSIRGGEVIDEEMESGDEFESGVHVITNTGGYDDDEADLIDIAADDEYSKAPSGKTKGVKQQNSMKIQRKKKEDLMGKEENKLVMSEGKNGKSEMGKRAVGKGKRKKDKEDKEEEKDDKYYMYQLVGVLVHSGSADAGHYYSFIKERGSSSRWLEFNDIHVRDFKISDLETECFGGNQNSKQNNSANILDDFNPADGRYFERCRNAYLLFYERINPIELAAAQDSELNIQNRINGVDKRIYERIWEENAAFMKLKIFFDQEYFQFVREYVNLYNFGDVHYQSQQHSDTFYLKKMRELTQQYKEEYPEIKIDYKKRYLEIEQESKVFGDGDVFGELDKIEEDPGLYTLKLATVLSQDMIMKVKDVQSFVQWMQLMQQLYERHAVACVWFIKHITQNRSVLEELLLNNHSYEVRENFAKLITTAIGVTAKNEEAYFEQMDEIFEFDCDQSYINDFTVTRKMHSKSAIIRFMDLYFVNMIDIVRIHWRRYEEYFTVLKDFLHLGFPEAQFMIVNCRGIYLLLEFVMNSSYPFSTIKYKMGDRGLDPNFTLPLEILSELINRCLTPGIQAISHYSFLSVFQDINKHIALPKEDISLFYTKACFTQEFLIKSYHSNEHIKNIVVQLAWGDFENSKFFITEIVESLKSSRGYDSDSHFKFLSALMRLNDREDLQLMRINALFNFEGFGQQSLFKFLETHKNNYKLFILKTLLFIGELCSQEVKVLEQVRVNQHQLTWVFSTVRNYHSDLLLQSETKDTNLFKMTETCINHFMSILDDDMASQPIGLEVQNELFEEGMGEQVKKGDNIFDFDDPREFVENGGDASFKAQNDSFEDYEEEDLANKAFINQKSPGETFDEEDNLKLDEELKDLRKGE